MDQPTVKAGLSAAYELLAKASGRIRMAVSFIAFVLWHSRARSCNPAWPSAAAFPSRATRPAIQAAHRGPARGSVRQAGTWCRWDSPDKAWLSARCDNRADGLRFYRV